MWGEAPAETLCSGASVPTGTDGDDRAQHNPRNRAENEQTAEQLTEEIGHSQ